MLAISDLFKLTIPLVGAAAIVACTGTGDPASDAGIGDGAASDGPRSTDGAGIGDDCAAWCQVRAPKEANDGFCSVGGESCVETCETLHASEELVPLQLCIEENPLCFVTMELCFAL